MGFKIDKKLFANVEKLNASTVLIVLAVVSLVVFIIYKRGKNKGSEQTEDEMRTFEIPETAGEIDESQSVRLSNELLEEMDYKRGFYWRKYRVSVFTDLQELNDATLLDTVRRYNEQFKNRDFLDSIIKVRSSLSLTPYVSMKKAIENVISRIENLGVSQI